jgi:hypothetical protein
VLPHVAAKQRPAALNQGVLAGGRIGDFGLAARERDASPA